VSALLKSEGPGVRYAPLTAVERRNRLAGTGALLSLILYAFWMDPEKTHLFRCGFREWTGWKCLACGLTHSLHASAHLDWAAAVKYHLFGPVLFWGAIMLVLNWCGELALDRKGPLHIRPGTIRKGMAVTGLVWLVYWLSRLPLFGNHG
jgi:hypothetical protein